MISAIIFDCFGVLTTDGWLPFKRVHFGDDALLQEQATALSKRCDAGLISYSDFVNGVAELSGRSTQEVRSEIESNVANEALFEQIAELKKTHKIGMLSNAGANWLDTLFSPEQLTLFDATALSYETGHIKPQPEAYQDIADRLGVPIGQCLLVDDQERFCTAAREAGMQAIWYKDMAQFTAELGNRVAASAR